MKAEQSNSNPAVLPHSGAALSSSPFRPFLVFSALLLAAFSLPLFNWVRYALGGGALFGHTILIPFISAYCVWIKRDQLPQPKAAFHWSAFVLLVLGAGLASTYLTTILSGRQLSTHDALFFKIASFISLFAFGAVLFLGMPFCRFLAFPLAFLIFSIPFPDVLTNALETASKHASAETYGVLMNLCGATYFRQGMVFHLPGLPIEVAQECSGIRSSLVLFITSLVAGHMFLSRPRNRFILCLIVLPLGVLRNAFRILVLSLLTIHWDPRVIDSALHHRGGPIFFALSLIPFLLLLAFFWRSEKSRSRASSPAYA